MNINKPDDLVKDLAEAWVHEPEAGIAQIHVFPFGAAVRVLEWLDKIQAQA